MSTELRSIDLEWDMRILNYATLIASFGSGGGRHRFTVCGTSVSRCHQRNRTCTFGAWRSTGSWRIMRGWAWRPAAAFRRRRNSCWSLSHVGLSGLMPIIICGNLLERECLSECRISHSRICRFIALLQISSLTLRHYHASSLKRTTAFRKNKTKSVSLTRSCRNVATLIYAFGLILWNLIPEKLRFYSPAASYSR